MKPVLFWLITSPHLPSKAMSTVITIKLPKVAPRNTFVVAAIKGFGSSHRVMKDRRAPRGGTRNRQRDYRSEEY